MQELICKVNEREMRRKWGKLIITLNTLLNLLIDECYINDCLSHFSIEFGIGGEGSHISTNQKMQSTVFKLLIG